MNRAALSIPLMVLVLGVSSSAVAFETNGKKWPEMPIKYWINPEECPVIEDQIGTEISIVDVMEHATAQWSTVSCAEVSFQYMGTTDETWGPDSQNTVYCVSNPEEWAFGPGAAGATLWIPQENEDDPMEVDLALNAAELNWVVGGGDALTDDTVDPRALVTHEIGHWLGMSHTPDPFATMYFATLPNALQMTLNGDDKAGLCSIYPNGAKECLYDEDCPVVGEFCDKIEGIRVCNEIHDGPGEFCSKEVISHQAICFTIGNGLSPSPLTFQASR